MLSFSLYLVLIFTDRYYIGACPCKKYLLSSSIILCFVSCAPLSFFPPVAPSPELCFMLFPDTFLLPSFLGSSLSYTRGRPQVFWPFQGGVRGCVAETVHVGWLQRELFDAASWHLLFGSCLFKCCKGFHGK